MLNRRLVLVATFLLSIGITTYFIYFENSLFKNSLKGFNSKIDVSTSSRDTLNSNLFERLTLYFENLTNIISSQEKTLSQLVHLLHKNSSPNEKLKRASRVELFDLNRALEPKSVYASIQCRKSASIQNIITELCVHDISKDVYVSGSIWSSGVWESNIVGEFLQYLINCEDCLVFDIGANIGQYSLYAAKLGRKVVSIEPFYDNILRLHKASYLETTSGRITLVKNAISDVRDRIMLLAKDDKNVGGQSLMNFKDKLFSEDDFNNPQYGNYLVRTILMDDLLQILPMNDRQESFKKAIMKIDIETFEPYAFKNASRLFNSLDFLVIFMEFMHFPKAVDMHKDVQNMIDFLYDHGLQAFDKANQLDRNTWKINWPGDIVWKKI